MKRFLWIAALISVVALVAAGLSAWQHLPFWPTVSIALAAILVNGWVATLEDDLPGGFNNPDGTHTPKYVVVVTWVVRTIGVIVGISLLGMLLLHFFGAR